MILLQGQFTEVFEAVSVCDGGKVDEVTRQCSSENRQDFVDGQLFSSDRGSDWAWLDRQRRASVPKSTSVISAPSRT